MHIVFFDTMPGEQEAFRASLPSHLTVEFYEQSLSQDTLNYAVAADIVSVFRKSTLSKQILDQLPELKLITTRSMGFDHIDLRAATANGIRVTNVTTYAARPVAEFTFALLLSVTRHITQANNQLREGTDPDIPGLTGVNLFGKTIGILGTGRIGRTVATIAHGFGMNVLGYDAHPDKALAAQHDFHYESLEHLITQSDIISVHVPSTPETHHLINAAVLARMKKGVIIINTARGEIIDTHALVAALRNGTVGGAGLDVLEAEQQLRAYDDASELPIDHQLAAAHRVLIDMPNVIVTPHIAFETVEALQEITRATAESINNFIAGIEQTYLS